MSMSKSKSNHLSFKTPSTAHSLTKDLFNSDFKNYESSKLTPTETESNKKINNN